jgi:hypothetical protein
MTHVDFKKKMQELMTPLGFDVFWGRRSLYNSDVKQVSEKTVIIEPFVLPFKINDKCYFDQNVTFWVGIRREHNEPTETVEGRDVEFMDEMHTEARSVIDAIANDSMFLVSEKLDTIEREYYEADETATVNRQSFITFTLNLRVWNAE